MPPARLAHLRNMRNNIRNMRNIGMFDALFPKVRQGVFTATMTQPEKWWFLSELAEYLGTTPSSLQRELSALVATGILVQRREGRRTYFKAQSRSPIFRELRGIVEKTAGMIPTIQAMLSPFGDKILCAFVYGSVARAQEHAGSDIDLMIIGHVGLAELTPALRKAERALGREVNVTNYAVEEFRERFAKSDHFLAAVVRRPKRFVKGSHHELDRITGA